jgi:hypothetical protein
MSTTIDRTELIRQRAYEIYLQRGRVPGRELEDWLTAEREVDSDLEPIVILEPAPAQDGSASRFASRVKGKFGRG